MVVFFQLDTKARSDDCNVEGMRHGHVAEAV